MSDRPRPPVPAAPPPVRDALFDSRRGLASTTEIRAVLEDTLDGYSEGRFTGVHVDVICKILREARSLLDTTPKVPQPHPGERPMGSPPGVTPQGPFGFNRPGPKRTDPVDA